MSERRCGTCRYFQPNVPNLQEGQCREGPPQPVLLGTDARGRPAVNGVHPPVRRTHWCGKWTEKPGAAQADQWPRETVERLEREGAPAMALNRINGDGQG